MSTKTRNYQDRDMSADAQSAQADLIVELRASARGLDRKHAIALATAILHELVEDGIDGGDIRNPQTTLQHVRSARNTLNKIGY